MKNSFIDDVKQYAKENRDRRHELCLKDTEGYWKSEIASSILFHILLIVIFITFEIVMCVLAINGVISV